MKILQRQEEFGYWLYWSCTLFKKQNKKFRMKIKQLGKKLTN